MKFPLLEQIRTATEELHNDVEARMNLLSPDLDAAGYVRRLETLRSWQLALARAWNAAHLNLPWDVEFDLRLKWLEEDLGPEPSPEVTTDAFSPETADEWWGAFYVLEGSSLGGQVITRHIRSRCPEYADRVHYFAGRAGETGPRWMRFLQHLGAHAPQLDADAVARGAVKTFNALRARL